MLICEMKKKNVSIIKISNSVCKNYTISISYEDVEICFKYLNLYF